VWTGFIWYRIGTGVGWASVNNLIKLRFSLKVGSFFAN
jgi:hypothetical protein